MEFIGVLLATVLELFIENLKLRIMEKMKVNFKKILGGALLESSYWNATPK